jgi:hypothetical protein
VGLAQVNMATPYPGAMLFVKLDQQKGLRVVHYDHILIVRMHHERIFMNGIPVDLELPVG